MNFISFSFFWEFSLSMHAFTGEEGLEICVKGGEKVKDIRYPKNAFVLNGCPHLISKFRYYCVKVSLSKYFSHFRIFVGILSVYNKLCLRCGIFYVKCFIYKA